jgi:hypothetical protein
VPLWELADPPASQDLGQATDVGRKIDKSLERTRKTPSIFLLVKKFFEKFGQFYQKTPVYHVKNRESSKIRSYRNSILRE